MKEKSKMTVERIVVECPREGEIPRMQSLTPRDEAPQYTNSMIRQLLSFCGSFDVNGKELKRVRTPQARDESRKVRILCPKTWQEFEDLYNDDSVLLELNGDEPVRVKRFGISPRKYFIEDVYPIQRLEGGESESL